MTSPSVVHQLRLSLERELFSEVIRDAVAAISSISNGSKTEYRAFGETLRLLRTAERHAGVGSTLPALDIQRLFLVAYPGAVRATLFASALADMLDDFPEEAEMYARWAWLRVGADSVKPFDKLQIALGYAHRLQENKKVDEAILLLVDVAKQPYFDTLSCLHRAILFCMLGEYLLTRDDRGEAARLANMAIDYSRRERPDSDTSVSTHARDILRRATS